MQRLSLRVARSTQLRAASSGRPPVKPEAVKPEPVTMTDEEVQELARGAATAERVWKLAAPERQWTLTSPATWVILAMIVYMQYQISQRVEETPEEAEKKRKSELGGWAE